MTDKEYGKVLSYILKNDLSIKEDLCYAIKNTCELDYDRYGEVFNAHHLEENFKEKTKLLFGIDIK